MADALPPTPIGMLPATLFDRIELFFCLPAFTSAVGDFTREKVDQFHFTDELTDEQPLSNHDIFQQYTRLVEAQLEAFLEGEGISAQQLQDAILEQQESPDAGASTCLDYLLATTTFESFFQLMADTYFIYHPQELLAGEGGGFLGGAGDDHPGLFGALEGEALEGGALEGGALEDEALEGLALDDSLDSDAAAALRGEGGGSLREDVGSEKEADVGDAVSGGAGRGEEYGADGGGGGGGGGGSSGSASDTRSRAEAKESRK